MDERGLYLDGGSGTEAGNPIVYMHRSVGAWAFYGSFSLARLAFFGLVWSGLGHWTGRRCMYMHVISLSCWECEAG